MVKDLTALLVVDSADDSNLRGNDAIRTRLESLGYNVNVQDVAKVSPEHARGMAVVVVSTVVAPRPGLNDDLLQLTVPVVVADGALLEAMRMSCRGHDADGAAPSRQASNSVRIGARDNPLSAEAHSLSASLRGVVEVTGSPRHLLCGRPGPEALVIATLARPTQPPAGGEADGGGPSAPPPAEPNPDEGRPVIFAYEKGAALCEDMSREAGPTVLELRAPARRVGLFINSSVAESLTTDGWALFDAAIHWAVGEELKTFSEVFRGEWWEIRERRQRQRLTPDAPAAAGGAAGHRQPPPPDPVPQHPPANLVGIALSGGGIRSATFCLGLLQGLRRAKILRAFDYVSTVSGGGYIGGWWSAWLSRDSGRGDVRSSYPFLNDNDIAEPCAFAARLLRDHDRKTDNPRETAPLSDFLRRQCSPEAVNMFRLAGERDGTEPQVRKVLSSQINAVLTKCCGERADLLEKVFAAAQPGDARKIKFLSQEAREMCARRADLRLRGRDLTRLELLRYNRMLLEDAYPKYIEAGIFPPFEKTEPERAEAYHRETGRGATALREDRRDYAEEKAEVAPDLLCAGDDPSHHLRLFANYLTPRKGLLSGDTWRAVAAIGRNLILTWLILLPLLFAAVLLGHLYFALHPNSVEEFAYVEYVATPTPTPALDANGVALAAAPAPAAAALTPTPTPETATTHRHAWDELAISQVMWARAYYAAVPSGVLLLLLIFAVSIWMLGNTSGKRRDGKLGAIVSWVMVLCAAALFYPRLWTWLRDDWSGTVRREGGVPFGFVHPHLQVLVPLLAAVAGALWLYIKRRPRDAAVTDTQGHLDLLRNRAVRVQTALLVGLAVTTFVLFFAGFGHELVQWTVNKLTKTADGETLSGFSYILKQLPQWSAVAGTVAAFAVSVFTAVKASPMGGGEQRPGDAPSVYSRFAFALAPPLMLLVLVMIASHSAHWLSWYVVSDYVNLLPPLNVAAFAGIYLCLLFALSEIRWRKQRETQTLITATSLLLVLAGVGLYYVLRGVSLAPLPWAIRPREVPVFVPLACALFFGVFVVVRLAVFEIKARQSHRRRSYRFVVFTGALGRFRPTAYTLLLLALGAYAALLAAGAVAVWLYDLTTFGGALRGALTSTVPDSRHGLFAMAAVNMALCLLCVILETFRGAGNNRRSLWLLASTYAVLFALLAVSFSHSYVKSPQEIQFEKFDYEHTVLLVHVVITLLASSVGWVVALGWAADPNALSMHSFYKERLVRAYLGASNRRRRNALKDVSEADEYDDLCLASLQNCQRGAPYHLINTTLNLAAGRDLAAAQRSSAMFVLSKLHCGSSRTGYRNTRAYMEGKLSLGTAVAASGAAASPNMGSRTPSASLAMLMTLLNVRLGYWAPTPNKGHWRLRLAQLWPFYTVREFLSQTHDLSSYCYLTDGGHFDNTGLYSLVERGCRFIVVADCGADNSPCYGDLGDAIRRCRIDFGTEITFDLAPLDKDKESRRPQRHFVVGHVNYNEKHLSRLLWDKKSIKERSRGIIVVFKPGVVGDESPDVRQYKLENDSFPQQSTADQWFDESQFESYRKLGYLYAYEAFDAFAHLFGRGAPFTQASVERVFNNLARKYCEAATGEFRQQLSEDFRKVVKEELHGGPAPTPGYDFYMEEMIRKAAGKITDMEDTRQPAEAARENLRSFTRETVKLAQEQALGRAQARLDEAVFLGARARRAHLFPFFDSGGGANRPHGNGKHSNGTRGNGKH